MDDTRDEREQSEKSREYGCDLCPTDLDYAALEQKMMHERQWDKELDRKLKEKN